MLAPSWRWVLGVPTLTALCLGLPSACGIPEYAFVDRDGCPTGYRDCDRDPTNGCETDISADANHCGACATVCANENGATRCAQGVCVPSCAARFGDCDGDPRNGCESDFDTAREHCGACGERCAFDHASGTCGLGECRLDKCDPGYEDCDGDAGNGCEADLSSPETCGECDNRCNGNGGEPICNADETCGIACERGRQDCTNGVLDGCETNLLANVLHCGGCDSPCAAPAGTTAVCDEGTCGVSDCASPFADCLDETSDGDTTCETDTSADIANCGGCGIECYYAEGVGRCNAGTCELEACDAGFGNCDDDLADGCEHDVTNDPFNCGACGNVCGPATPFCIGGSCRARLEIAVRSTVSGSVATTGANLTLSHNLRSARDSHRAIFVGVAGRGNNPNARPAQVTYNGVPMLLAQEAPLGIVHAAIYYLTENDLPNPGTYNLVVRPASSQSTFGFIANLLELTGVERGTRAIDARAATESETCRPVTSQVTVATLGALAYGILAIDGAAAPGNLQASGQTPTMAQTTILGELGAAAGRLGAATGTGAVSFNWSQPARCNRWRHALVAIRPAVTL